jgi:hypothetical protein
VTPRDLPISSWSERLALFIQRGIYPESQLGSARIALDDAEASQAWLRLLESTPFDAVEVAAAL